MGNRMLSAGIFALVALFQFLVIRNAFGKEYTLSFITIYKQSDRISELMILALLAYLPVPFMLFFAYDDISEITGGNSKLMIIRNYDRSLLFLRKKAETMIWILLMIVFMIVLSTAFDGSTQTLDLGRKMEAVLLYFMVIVDIILIKDAMELLLLPPQVTNVAVNIFFLSSLLLTNDGKTGILNYIFFPRLAFSDVNGVVATGSVLKPFAFLGIGCILMLVLCERRYRKVDIY